MNESTETVIETPGEAPPVVEAKDEPTGKKLTKVDIKRIQAYQERRKRLLNKGVEPSQVDKILAEEDYRALPMEKKFERLQVGINQAFQEFAKDINALQHNNNILSDVLDTNLRAFSRCLAKAGVSLEDQGTIIAEVEREIAADRLAKLNNAQKVAEETAKKHQEQTAAEALKQAEGKPTLSEEQAPAPPPDGATTFGG